MNHKPHRQWRSGAKQQRARELRQSQTRAETLLWDQLRNRRLDGWKFRRQHPLDRFIVDFCCIEQRLVVEVDGTIHDHPERSANDQERAAQISALGYRIIRFRNEQVCRAMPTVLEELRSALMPVAHDP